MKRIGHLFSKVTRFENLLLAAKKASRGKKMKSSVAKFIVDLETEVIDIQERLIQGTYRPSPYHQFRIFEPKERSICSSEFRDRVVHHALCNVTEPYFESRHIRDSYACRMGLGAHLAIKKCQYFSRANQFFLKCDISKYFDSIDHQVMKDILHRLFKDEQLMNLIHVIIDHAVPGSPIGKGLPIGNLTSQHFANLYLGELDNLIKRKYRIGGYLRYMDDFITFHDSKSHLVDVHRAIEAFVSDRLKLKLKPTATILAPVSEGVPFLGFRIFRENIRMQRKNVIRLRKTITGKERAYRKGLITEAELIQSLQSVHAHVQHANVHGLLSKEVLRSLKMA